MPRRSAAEIEKSRQTLTLRGVEREYGFARSFIGERVRAGEIPCVRRGRALCVLRSDFENWFRSQALRPAQSHAEGHAARLLEKDAARERAGAGAR